MDKAYIKRLLDNKEYRQILSYIRKEYKKLIYNFLISKGEKVSEKESLNTLIIILGSSYKEYNGVAKLIQSLFLEENKKIVDILNDLIDYYPIILKRLT